MAERVRTAPAAAPGLRELVPAAQGEGMGLDELRLRAGEVWSEAAPEETAILLLRGTAELAVGEVRVTATRRDPFRERGWVLSAPADALVEVSARDDAELLRVRVGNPASFLPRAYGPDDAFVDHRGQGRALDAAYRVVRTYFDRRNAPPESRLVVGEVVNGPGRWSSYPPHHHAQPELYHYRFEPEGGYGHAEHGDEVFKVKDRDTLCIAPGHDHAQCAAPGYAMLYVWTIRHLDGQPYEGPAFAPAHAAALDRPVSPLPLDE